MYTPHVKTGVSSLIGIFILLLNPLVHFAQNCNVSAGSDRGICLGDSTTLNVSNAGLTWYWTPSAGLSDSTSLSPVASPAVTTDYIFSSRFVMPSIIVNGDFSQGNSGFSSNYHYTLPPNTAEGQYWVSQNAQLWNVNMSSCPDHSTGTGNMMIVNGATHLNVSVWCQSVTVLPNTDYAFSCWLASEHSTNPALLQFSINNQPLGNPFNASAVPCQWQQFYVIWNSGNNTTANICIVNQNSQSSGNDFALDDISFSQLCEASDTVTVFISKPDASFSASPLTGCDTQTVSFSNTSAGAVNSFWDFGDNTTSTTLNPSHLYHTGHFDISVIVTDSIGCSDTLVENNLVFVRESPVAGFTGSPLLGCDSLHVNFTNASQRAVNFQWDFGNGATSSAVNPHVDYSSGNYNVTLIVSDSMNCSDTLTRSSYVLVQDNPVASFSSQPGAGTPVPYVNNTITFNNQSHSATNYAWSFGDSSVSYDLEPQHSFAFPGQYNVQLIAYSSLGCADTALATYTVYENRKDSAALYVPNSFTPNGDMINDSFIALGYGFKDFDMKIFNRWGELIFETKDPSSGWTGKCNNQPCTPGVYVFHIVITLTDGQEEQHDGYVTLIR